MNLSHCPNIYFHTIPHNILIKGFRKRESIIYYIFLCISIGLFIRERKNFITKHGCHEFFMTDTGVISVNLHSVETK
jgi:hypothetical protein